LEESVNTEAHLRKAQKTLAEEMTRLVHSESALADAQRITKALFSGDIKALSASEMKAAFKDVPSIEMAREPKSIVDLIVDAGISPSKRQAREDITNGAISVNGEKVTDLEYTVDEKDRLEDEFAL